MTLKTPRLVRSIVLAAAVVAVPVLVLAADGDVTPEFLCEEFAGTKSAQCVRCANKILPRAEAAVERCEQKCSSRFKYEDDRLVCEIDCLQIFKVHFENNCRR